MSDKPLSRRTVADLFLPGLYNAGLDSDMPAREAINDATYDAYLTGGMSGARRAFRSAVDGYLIARGPLKP